MRRKDALGGVFWGRTFRVPTGPPGSSRTRFAHLRIVDARTPELRASGFSISISRSTSCENPMPLCSHNGAVISEARTRQSTPASPDCHGAGASHPDPRATDSPPATGLPAHFVLRGRWPGLPILVASGEARGSVTTAKQQARAWFCPAEIDSSQRERQCGACAAQQGSSRDRSGHRHSSEYTFAQRIAFAPSCVGSPCLRFGAILHVRSSYF